MKEVSYEKAVRCFAVSCSRHGLQEASAMLSNMFDLHPTHILSDLKDAKIALALHCKHGGMLKAFEQGNIRTGPKVKK